MLLTNGNYASPAFATTDVKASLSTTSHYGQRIDMASLLTARTGALHYVTYAPIIRADLLALLHEWIEAYPTEAAPDFEAQKAELESNRISFGVA